MKQPLVVDNSSREVRKRIHADLYFLTFGPTWTWDFLTFGPTWTFGGVERTFLTLASIGFSASKSIGPLPQFVTELLPRIPFRDANERT